MKEAAYIVSVEGDGISVTDPNGEEKRLVLANLNGVTIETNDSGPIGTDLWWLLFGADDSIAAVFPQGATGETASGRLAACSAGFRSRDHDHGDGFDLKRGVPGVAARCVRAGVRRAGSR